MDQRPRLRVRPRPRRPPERPAQMDRPKVRRVHERVRPAVRARAVVRERPVVVRPDVRKVAPHRIEPILRVRPEPRRVPVRARHRVVEVLDRLCRVALRCWGGGVQRGLLRGRAACELRALDYACEAGARDGELAGLECCGVWRGGRAEGGDGVVGGDEVEEVGRADGVLAVARAGEVVGRGHWKQILDTIPLGYDTRRGTYDRG